MQQLKLWQQRQLQQQQQGEQEHFEMTDTHVWNPINSRFSLLRLNSLTCIRNHSDAHTHKHTYTHIEWLQNSKDTIQANTRAFHAGTQKLGLQNENC